MLNVELTKTSGRGVVLQARFFIRPLAAKYNAVKFDIRMTTNITAVFVSFNSTIECDGFARECTRLGWTSIVC